MTPELFLVMTLFIFLSGLCLGSFLNVCIWRIPRNESIVWPGSHCPACNHALAAYENIPLVSWLFLRGRCRHCHTPISPRYFVVELLTAFLFVCIWFQHGMSALTPLYIFFTGALMVGAFIDIDHMILPDRITWGGMCVGPVLCAFFPILQGEVTWVAGLVQSVVGMCVGFGLLWGVSVMGRLALKRDAMGFGDVKLFGAIGACLGWKAVLFTIFLSSLTGTLVGLLLIGIGKRELQSRIPYGPHIALAAVVWMLVGREWTEAYIRWVTGG